jgi:hypothetical protein
MNNVSLNFMLTRFRQLLTLNMDRIQEWMKVNGWLNKGQ